VGSALLDAIGADLTDPVTAAARFLSTMNGNAK
jgi:hypothetical protein